MIRSLEHIAEGAAYDIVVVGGGGAGMAAALFAAIENQSVLLIERTESLGGTTALSAGTLWIPNTLHANKAHPEDSLGRASRFLDAAVGNYSRRELRQAFLASGPHAVAALESSSDVHLRPFPMHPDYEQEFDGATLRGRALEPAPFDGRQLGPYLGCIRPPLPEFTILGGMMVDRIDVGHLLNFGKSPKSFAHATAILTRYGIDRLLGRRASRLVMGNALIGRLLLSLLKKEAAILLQTSVTALEFPSGASGTLTLQAGHASRRIHARRGIILAAGGYTHHPIRRQQMLAHGAPCFTPTAPGATGEIQDLAVGLGARFGEGNLDRAYWAPVSVRQRPDGTMAVFPHFVLDRSKPGTVCVNQSGRRFVNESTSYHRFTRAMLETHSTSPCIPAFLIADAMALRKYGLGMVPMQSRLGSFLADGYLIEGTSLDALAQRLEIDAAALATTINRMNEYARTGVDPEFGRGTTLYHRINGDPSHGPNPTLGPIRTAPFYAVRLYPGDIATATGLVTDEWARVIDGDDRPIGVLYACGNEANSVMGGAYPAPGITLGLGIVFAYRAIQHAVGRARSGG